MSCRLLSVSERVSSALIMIIFIWRHRWRLRLLHGWIASWWWWVCWRSTCKYRHHTLIIKICFLPTVCIIQRQFKNGHVLGQYSSTTPILTILRPVWCTASVSSAFATDKFLDFSSDRIYRKTSIKRRVSNKRRAPNKHWALLAIQSCQSNSHTLYY